MLRSWHPLPRVLVIALLTANIVGCIPARSRKVPEMKGRIREGTKPISGAIIRWVNIGWEHGDNKRTVDGSATTNERGEFIFQGNRTWRAAPPFPVDSYSRWSVELMSSGQTLVLWQEKLLGPGPPTTPEHIEIDCNLIEKDPCVLINADKLLGLGPIGRRLPHNERAGY
jgi:hypothetical protein